MAEFGVNTGSCSIVLVFTILNDILDDFKVLELLMLWVLFHKFGWHEFWFGRKKLGVTEKGIVESDVSLGEVSLMCKGENSAKCSGLSTFGMNVSHSKVLFIRVVIRSLQLALCSVMAALYKLAPPITKISLTPSSQLKVVRAVLKSEKIMTFSGVPPPF